MLLLLSCLVGLLSGTAIYLILHRNLRRVLPGVLLLLLAICLLIITAGAPGWGSLNNARLALLAADPLPQVLAITALAVGLGMVLTVLALAWHSARLADSDDIDRVTTMDGS
jgi:multisubunit Na+/H+ antiporter MnhC subunit